MRSFADLMRTDLALTRLLQLARPALPAGAGRAGSAGDAKKMRGERPFVFTKLKTGQRLDSVIGFIRRQGLML